MEQFNRLSDKKRIIDKKLIAQILSNYFDNVCKFKYSLINQGLENLSYLITLDNKKFVLRIYNDRQFGKYNRSEREIRQELEFMDCLTTHNLPVPEIIKTKIGKLFSAVSLQNKSHFVALFSFVSGKEVKIFNMPKIRAVANLQANMHIIAEGHIKPRRRINGHLGHQKWQREILEDAKPVHHDLLFRQYKKMALEISKIIKSIKAESLVKLFVHTDVHEGNMRFQGNRVRGLFDFDDARVSIVPEDIGMFLSVILKSGDLISKKNKADVYFKQYEKVRKLSDYEKYLSLIFAIEKRLVYKLHRIKIEIETSEFDKKSYEKALRSMRVIKKLAK